MTIVIVNNEGMGGGNEHKDSDVELVAINEEGIVDELLDHDLFSDLFVTTKLALFKGLHELRFLRFVDGLESFVAFSINRSSLEERDHHIVFSLGQSLEKVLTFRLLGQIPGRNLEFVNVEAFELAGSEFLGVLVQSTKETFLSVQDGVAGDMVGGLREARELLTQVLVLVHVVSGVEDMSIRTDTVDFSRFFALGHVGTNIGVEILTNAGDNLVSQQRVGSGISEKVHLFKELVGVLGKVFSVILAVFVIADQSKERLVVLISGNSFLILKVVTRADGDELIESLEDFSSKDGVFEFVAGLK